MILNNDTKSCSTKGSDQEVSWIMKGSTRLTKGVMDGKEDDPGMNGEAMRCLSTTMKSRQALEQSHVYLSINMTTSNKSLLLLFWWDNN